MKKLIGLFLSIVMGVSALTLFACSNKVEEPIQEEKSNVTTVQSIACSFSSSVTTYSTGTETVSLSKRISAVVSPATALNKAVDYSVAWAEDASLKEEDVSEYVSIKQDSDGSLEATVYCYKDFGDDKIVITVTARDGGATGTCVVSYKGVASKLEIQTNATKLNSEERGDYYQLKTGQDYTFNINLSNVIGGSVESDVSVSVGAVGSLYVATGPSNMASDSGTTYINLEEYDISRFFTYTLDGNVITVSPSGQSFTPLSSFVYYLSSGQEYQRYVIPNYDQSVVDEFGSRVGLEQTPLLGQYTISEIEAMGYPSEPGCWMLLYKDESQYNAEHVPSSYLYVTVKDNISKMSETIKIWIVSGVESVNIDPANLEF